MRSSMASFSTQSLPAVAGNRPVGGQSAPLPDAVSNRYQRVGSIDFVRGLAMVFMALDHTRDYITNYPYSPTNLAHTWPLLFFVRWVTHYCAPAFFLLAGVGAYLYGRKRSPSELQTFLLTRGVWLIFLEYTVIGFGWSFIPGWGMEGVIACLGLSMILLAAFVRAPRYLTMAVALAIIAAHDLFDGIQPASFHSYQWLLYLLHHGGAVQVGNHWLLVLFPFIPWCAVTLLGFSMGQLFEASDPARLRTLFWTGSGAVLLFIVLRLTNLYGNPGAGVAYSSPGDWHPQATLAKTVILFLDVEKYPASLQYLLMTLGPIFILLATVRPESWGFVGRALTTFGRVPLFFYLLHIYLIHLVTIAIGLIAHQPIGWLFHGAIVRHRGPLLAVRMVRPR
jgi:uncharacterized membrane protein